MIYVHTATQSPRPQQGRGKVGVENSCVTRGPVQGTCSYKYPRLPALEASALQRLFSHLPAFLTRKYYTSAPESALASSYSLVPLLLSGIDL